MKTRILLLVLFLGIGTATRATNFISDIMVSTHTNQTTAMSQLTNAGYTPVYQDMNQGGGGHYVYIGYKTSTNLADAITGLLVVQGSSYAGDQNKTVTLNGATFQAVSFTRDSKGGNLNRGRGASATDLYLYYTKYGNTTHVSESLWKPITGLDGAASTSFRSRQSYPTYVRQYSFNILDYTGLDNANLNLGGGADYYTFLNVTSTHTCSLTYELVAVGHRQYCSVCGYTRSTAACTFTGNYIAHNSSQCYRVCSVCQLKTYLDHKWSGTYTSSTETQHFTSCTYCNYRKMENHLWTDWKESGSSHHQRVCGRCNHTALAPHSWKYTNLGNMHRKTCSVPTCSYSSTENHTLVVDAAAVPATCTTAGSTEACHCSLCTYTNAATTISALGHRFDDYGVCTRTAGQKHYSHAQGDVTLDGRLSVADIVRLVYAVMNGHWANADYDDNGVIDASDFEALVNALLSSGE